MPKKPRPFNFEYARRLYRNGHGIERLAYKFGIGQGRLHKMLLNCGDVAVRSRSDAMRLRWQRATKCTRDHLLAAAHAAATGRKRSSAEIEASSHARAHAQQKSRIHTGRFEDVLETLLRQRGCEPVPQLAVERYNLDLGLAPVAVEVHVAANNPLADSGIRQRLKRLLKLKWWVIYVWVTAAYPLTDAAADEIVAYYKRVKRNPTARSQYRVIRGSGQATSSRLYMYE